MAEINKDYEKIVIDECTRIIIQYIEICKANNDTPFIEALSNPEKATKYCINHIMNNLTKKRTMGGADSLMYEYIHEYYVDSFTEVEDHWSSLIGNGGTNQSNKSNQSNEKNIDVEKIKAEAKEEALKSMAKEIEKAKNKAVLEYKEEQKRIKAEEAAKKKAELEAKVKAKEEAKKKAEASKPKQTSLFDFM